MGASARERPIHHNDDPVAGKTQHSKKEYFFLKIKGTYHPFLGFHLFFWKTRVGLLDILEGPFQVPHCVTIPTALGSLKETQVLAKCRSPKHSPMPDEQPVVSTKDHGRGTTGELTSN